MSIDSINDRPKPVDPQQDPQVAPGQLDQVEQEIETTFESLRSDLEEMLQFNFAVIKELLGQIGAINPFRPDSAFGKQPDVATIDAANDQNSAAIAPVGAASAEAYVAGLQHIEGRMGAQDLKMQALYDKMALSRSGHKPELTNQGSEFERLKTIMIQAEGRMNQALAQLPETLPETTGSSVTSLMPEFVDALNSFDNSFRHALEAVRHEILLTKKQ